MEIEGLPQTQIEGIHFCFGSTPGDAVGTQSFTTLGFVPAVVVCTSDVLLTEAVNWC